MNQNKNSGARGFETVLDSWRIYPTVLALLCHSQIGGFNNIAQATVFSADDARTLNNETPTVLMASKYQRPSPSGSPPSFALAPSGLSR